MFGLLDANYVLMRQKNMMMGEAQYENKVIDKSVLYGSFINCVMKYKREYDIQYMVLFWDKSPYYHTVAIENYKADRHNSTEEVASLKEQLKNPDLTEEERAALLEQLRIEELDSKNFWAMNEVKVDFLDNAEWKHAGFHSIYKRGYEADQLAMYVATKISKLYQKNKAINAVLLTADKDWVNFQQDGVEFISIYNGSRYENLENEYQDALKEYDEAYPNAKVKLDMYSYGILRELGGATHNNASVMLEDDEVGNNLPWSEYFYRVLNKKTLKDFKSYDILVNAYEAMNVFKGTTCDNGYCKNVGTKYTDDIEEVVSSVLKDCDKFDSTSIRPLIDEHDIHLNLTTYSKYTSTLKNVMNF
jgi:hypothetical protein